MKSFSLRDLLGRIGSSVRRSAPDNCVSLVLDGNVRVEQASPELIEYLRSLGGHEETVAGGAFWVIEAQSDEELGVLLGKLRDEGVIFAGGPVGWTPAAIFKDLRERQLLSGEFREVVWVGGGRWVVSSQ